MRNLHQLMACLGVMLGLTAPAETNAPLFFRFKGILVDPDGALVSGATVESFSGSRMYRVDGGQMKPENEQRVVTTNGTFELQLPRQGALILARKAGLAPT